MERKNISIREDQSRKIEEQDLNLSQFVREQLDEHLGPSDDELAQAYQENAEQARETNEAWEHASIEANQHLDDASDGDS